MMTTNRWLRSARINRRSSLLVLAACLLPIGVSAEPMLTIDEVHWTDGVRAAHYGQIFDDTAPLQPLYLWMRVSGKSEALRALQAQGKLPIRHRWFKVVGDAFRFDQSTDAINLDIGS